MESEGGGYLLLKSVLSWPNQSDEVAAETGVVAVEVFSVLSGLLAG